MTPLDLPWGPNAGHEAAPTEHTSVSPGTSGPGLAGPHVASHGGTADATNAGLVVEGEAATSPALVIDVFGTPAPQGSKRHVGNGVMVESSKKVKPWRMAVKYAAMDACIANLLDWSNFPAHTPVHVNVIFCFARPRFHYRTGRNAHLLRDGAPKYPSGRPDLDKLLRSTLDALGEAGVFADDAQVCHVEASKAYVGAHPLTLDRPGCVIQVWAL